MNGYSEPRITLGGVPVFAQNINWQLTSGVMPFQTSLQLHKNYSDQLAGANNPVTLKIEAYGGVGAPKKEIIEFRNLYLQEPVPLIKTEKEIHVSWKIADCRWLMRGKKVFSEYNITRMKNEKGSSSQNVSFLNDDPAKLSEPFRKFSQGRYLEWTTQKNGNPWTIKQILGVELKKLGIEFDNTNPEDYIIENVRFEGEPAYNAIAELLAASRLSLGIKPEGKLYIYSLDFFEKNQETMLKNLMALHRTEPGIIYLQDLKRTRPKNVKVRFDRIEEVWLKATPPNNDHKYINQKRSPTKLAPGGAITQKMIDNWRAFACINVIPVPAPLKINGRKFNIGEYATMVDFFSSIPINEKKIRELWWSSLLDLELSKILLGGSLQGLSDPEPFARMLAGSIRKHYRQTFMIDPVVYDFIDFFETSRVSVIDNYSQARPPSPVFCDFCTFPKFRSYLNARKGKLYARNYWVDREDPKRERPTTLKTIRVLDAKLGVFSIEYNNDVTMTVDDIIPSAVLPEPKFDPRLAQFLLDRSYLAQDFTMETIITVNWLADKLGKFDSPKNFYEINFPMSGGKFGTSLGPDIEFLSRQEVVRTDYKGNNANQGIINAIAEIEVAKIMNSYKDRQIGLFTTPGLRQDIQIEGNIKSISYNFDEKAGATTTVDMRDIPPEPSLIQELPVSARNYLFKQVVKGQ